MTIYLEYRIRNLTESLSETIERSPLDSDAAVNRFVLEGRRSGTSWEPIGQYPTRTEAEQVFAGIAGQPYQPDQRNTVHIEAHLVARGQIASIWSTQEVRALRPHLLEYQAWDVLRMTFQDYDLSSDHAWETLEEVADRSYPPPEDNHS
jgi:hypothetical protein